MTTSEIDIGRRAHEHFVRGEIHAARAVLDEAPEAVVLLALRARCQMSAGNLAEASRLARRALGAADDGLQALLQGALHAVALVELREGRLDESEALLDRLMRLDAVDEDLLFEATLLGGEIAYQRGRSDELLLRYKGVVDRARQGAPRHRLARALMVLGTELRRRGQQEEGAPLLAEARAIAVAMGAEGLVVRADASTITYTADGEDIEAHLPVLRDLTAAMERLGEITRATVLQHNLGARLLGLGRLEEAEVVLRAAFARSETRHRVVIGTTLVDALRRQGKMQEAHETLTPLLAVPPRQQGARLKVLLAGLSDAAHQRDWIAWQERVAEALPALLNRPSPTVLDLLRGAMTDTLACEEAPWGRAALLAALGFTTRGAVGFERREESDALDWLRAQGAPIPLGPYLLLAEIGQGGMGRVWRARDTLTGEERAIKTLSSVTSSAARAALEREAAAMAQLEHPHVVSILDRGVADEAADRVSGGRVAAGTAWLAMPLLPRTLHELCGTLTWASVQNVLMALLDALGWSHALGLLHLDLKPANVLLERERPPYIVRLADFGLTRAMRSVDGSIPVSGTPQYMAPEQFLQRWREWGPHTDLYALGVLAAALVQGVPPFPGRDIQRLRDAHLYQDVPPLRPRVAVPAGFEPWVQRLLAKAPTERFGSAASAAAALMRLGEPEVGPYTSASPAIDDQVTFDWMGGVEPWDEAPPPEIAVELVDQAFLPFPSDWRTAAAVRATGTPALLALRQVEIVGRERERDALWRALGRASAKGRPQVALLRGLSGMGSSRLLRWLAVRAASLGVARVLSSEEDVADALRQALRAEGLQGEALQAHLIQTVWRPAALPVELALQALEGGGNDHVIDALGCLAEAGPVLLVVPWARRPQAVLQVVEGLARRPGRILVAMSMRDEEGLGHPWLEEELRRLELQREWTTIRVDGLSRQDLKAVVSSLVALEPTLLERVVERAKGNAAYAVSLVKHWQATGALIAGHRGWMVSPAAEQTAPPLSESAAWLDGLGGVSEDLEQLAVLGSAEEAVWSRALGRPLGDSVRRLMDQGVVRESDGRWFIAAPAVSDTLLERVSRGGRRLRLQQAAADALEGRNDAHSQRSRGRHLLAVGRAHDAMAPLLEGAKQTMDSGERLAVLAMAEQAMWATGVPTTDRRWLSLWAAKLEALHEREQSAVILEMLPDVESLAEFLEDSEHRWRGPFYRAVLTERDPRPALRVLIPTLPEGDVRAHLVLQLAWYELLGGGIDSCEALIGSESWDNDEHDMLALELRSEVARRRGHDALALELATRSAAKAVVCTSRLGPSVWCQLGDLRRGMGDLDGAKHAYAEAAALARQRDSPVASLIALNVLIVRFEQGETLTWGELEVVRRGLGEREISGRIATDLLALAMAPDDEMQARTEALLRDAPPAQPELWLLAQRVHALRGGLEALVAHLTT